VNFRVKRGRDRSLFLRLAAGDWVRQHEILLLVGPTGTGKSWLACALGHAACRHGATVRYVRLPRLLGDLASARGDGSYGRLLQQFAKTDLLILDDWGLAPMGDRERRDLLEIIEDRTGQRATLITSQVPIEHWHDLIGDATFGDAILDRLVHHAHRIVLTGGSMRKLLPPMAALLQSPTE
jgi:DNA replication protein DnaC